ncbi:MAG: 4-hydroxy-tetrahydrodipicolinate reductase [Clostridia bacterium]|nr:4-hydroxy-tetrahydrodipicolinate reductase [Clostridia bacterium]
MNIILNGFSGRMGAAVLEVAGNGYMGSEVVAGVDINPKNGDIPCYTSFSDIKESADCIIDFSNHASIKAAADYAVTSNLPLVVATTGHTDEEKEIIRKASEAVPVFFAANMSMGVALLCQMATLAAKTLPGADIEIVEKHHNRKVDAPSGTALMIANAIKTVRENAKFVFGRNGFSKRAPEEIGIHALRLGNIVGEHEVIVSTDYETITLKHEAHSRTLFAEGAIAAAAFIIGKEAGLYDMSSLIG